VVALTLGGGAPAPTPPGIPDAGPVTGWGLPLSRLASDLAVVVVTGLLLTAAVLLPAADGRLCEPARRAARWARTAAALALLAVAVQTALGLAHLLGLGPVAALDPTQLTSYVLQTTPGLVLFGQLSLLGLVTLTGRWLQTNREAGVATAAAVTAAALPALSGHAAGAPNHTLAVATLAGHVAAVTCWVGGLAGLVLVGRTDPGHLASAATRFSPLALGCAAVTGITGTVNAVLRVQTPDALLQTGYGRLVLAKTAAFAVLVVIGRAHRRRTLPPLRAGRRRAFARLAGAEAVLMAATIGLAVGLSRTPPPPLTGHQSVASRPTGSGQSGT